MERGCDVLAPAVNGAVTALTQRSYSSAKLRDSYRDTNIRGSIRDTNIRGSNASCPACSSDCGRFVSANKKDTAGCHVSPIKTKSAYKERN